METLRPVIRVMPLATIKQRRMLPVPGRVVVNRGQAVKATETVAEARLEPRYRLVNVAAALGLPRAKADELIQCREGEVVRQGDPLAEKQGLFRQVVRAPVDGEVVLVGDGQVLLREYRAPWELRAGIPAKVTEVFPDRGVELTTRGAVVDGVWGNGRLGYGTIHPITEQGTEAITPSALGVELRGLVLVGGYVAEARVLEIAESLPTRALIVGSMRARLIPAAQKVSYPILLINGFGTHGMDERAFRLLSSNKGREAAVLAERWEVYQGERPAVILPLTTTEVPSEPPAAALLEPGTVVRVTRSPHMGKIGRIIALPTAPVRFANGLRGWGADIRFDDGETAQVPLADLEVLVQS